MREELVYFIRIVVYPGYKVSRFILVKECYRQLLEFIKNSIAKFK